MTSSARSLQRCGLGSRWSPSGNPHGLSLLRTGDGDTDAEGEGEDDSLMFNSQFSL